MESIFAGFYTVFSESDELSRLLLTSINVNVSDLLSEEYRTLLTAPANIKLDPLLVIIFDTHCHSLEMSLSPDELIICRRSFCSLTLKFTIRTRKVMDT